MTVDLLPTGLVDDPWPEVASVGQAACDHEDVEAALAEIVRAALRVNGDAESAARPGALKPGERQFFVSGVFLATPDQSAHLLVAEWGFPPKQHRLRFAIETGHPGWVWRHRRPLILENTDDHADFKQILKTARMGSALYAPMLWEGAFVGQLIVAAQARNTFRSPDLDRMKALAALAVGVYIAKEGPAWLEREIANPTAPR